MNPERQAEFDAWVAERIMTDPSLAPPLGRVVLRGTRNHVFDPDDPYYETAVYIAGILAAPSAPPSDPNLGHMHRMSDEVPQVPQIGLPSAQTPGFGAASNVGTTCPKLSIFNQTLGHLGHVKSFLSYVRAHTHKRSTGTRAPSAPSRGARR